MRRTAMAILAATVVFGLASCSGVTSGLVGPTWQWTQLTENHPKHQSVVPDPSNYTIEFTVDGHFQAKADCNQVSGSYTASGSSLTLNLGPSTLVACGADSLGDQFTALLHTVSGFSVSGTKLTMTLANDAGEMGFDQGS